MSRSVNPSHNFHLLNKSPLPVNKIKDSRERNGFILEMEGNEGKKKKGTLKDVEAVKKR